jgi:hypothetical protein
MTSRDVVEYVANEDEVRISRNTGIGGLSQSSFDVSEPFTHNTVVNVAYHFRFGVCGDDFAIGNSRRESETEVPGTCTKIENDFISVQTERANDSVWLLPKGAIGAFEKGNVPGYVVKGAEVSRIDALLVQRAINGRMLGVMD